MVVHVVGDAGRAAKQLGLVFRLEPFGAREQAARGDAVLDEARVVGAAAELGGDRRRVVGGEEGGKVLFDDV